MKLIVSGIAAVSVVAVAVTAPTVGASDTDGAPVDTVVDEIVAETLIVEEVQDVAPGSTIVAPPIDDDILEAAVLTADDLNAAPELDHLGDGWEAIDDGLLIEVSGGDHAEGQGLCPEGDDFVEPAVVVSIILGNDDYPVSEQLLSFERSSSADSWVAAYQSCLDDAWVLDGDPDEHMTVVPIDIGKLGQESIGFLLLSEHASSSGPEHGDGVALVRISPTVLVKVKLWGDEPPADPYDPTILNDLTTAAVAKIEAVLG